MNEFIMTWTWNNDNKLITLAGSAWRTKRKNSALVDQASDCVVIILLHITKDRSLWPEYKLEL